MKQMIQTDKLCWERSVGGLMKYIVAIPSIELG